MSKLKPCPFCGELPKIKPAGYGNGTTEYTRFNCACYEQVMLLETWNDRPIEDKLQAEIDMLKQLNSELTSKAYHAEHSRNLGYEKEKLELYKEIDRLKADLAKEAEQTIYYANKYANVDTANKELLEVLDKHKEKGNELVEVI